MFNESSRLYIRHHKVGSGATKLSVIFAAQPLSVTAGLQNTTLDFPRSDVEWAV